MSLRRSRYKELGLELLELEKDHPHYSQCPQMVEENKDDVARDPIKMFLK